ncbi:MAG TPA: hypothetical protein VK614_08690 [Allosphingosinicella sp.]|nr:hypothetical protein [Allosphingosinicella sp.]
MSGAIDSAGPARRLIDTVVKVRFLASLRAGAHRDAAAREAGFSPRALYTARRRDPVFRLGWAWALELSAADEREQERAARVRDGGPADAGADAGADGDGIEITPNNQRALQKRKVRSVRFGAARRKIFLDHFAGTADAFAAAEAAGVSYSTVYQHRARDPQFAEDWDTALRQSYVLLEAESVRQRLAAQAKLRETPEPTGEMAKEFERVMLLLARMDRRDGRIGTREVQHGRQRRWTFEEAMVALDKRLRALGLRHGIPGDTP